MLLLKKSTLALLAFSSSFAMAGTMGTVCTPGNVTVPCERTAWDVGIQALYLKPSYNASWSYAGSTSVNDLTTYNEYIPDWNWGFRLEGSYHFNTGNDLTVNWLYFSNESSQGFAVQANSVTGRFKPTVNAVNIEMGQHVDFGQMKNIRFHGGVQYANLKETANVLLVTNNSLYYGGDARTSAFGPRAGADMSYDVNANFAVYGNAAGAVLVGTSKFDNNRLPNGGASRGSKTAVVPNLEGKLGMKYMHQMDSGDLSVDLGWMWTNYFNAMHFIGGQGVVRETNFALNGPYVGVKYVGNV